MTALSLYCALGKYDASNKHMQTDRNKDIMEKENPFGTQEPFPKVQRLRFSSKKILILKL